MSYFFLPRKANLASKLAIMPGAIDSYQLEKKVAQKSTAAIKSALRSAINSTTVAKTGNASRTANSGYAFKQQRLQRLTLQAPHYIFKQHYGFEGKKSNGVNMRLKATNVLNIALERTNALDYLADEITAIRSEEVTSLIRF